MNFRYACACALSFLVLGLGVISYSSSTFEMPTENVVSELQDVTFVSETATPVSDVKTSNENTADEYGKPAELPRPSDVSVEAFEHKLYEFLDSRKYQDLGWSVDKSMRDTGPYIKGRSYGTHPAVRVYYSPEVIEWLVNKRVGTIPDGAVIIKEQYEEPAARHHGKSEDQLRDSLKSWTVMVKDSEGSYDGWFWSNPFPSGDDRTPKVADNHKYPFYHPESGFGHYCVRCHAATQSPNIESPSKNNEFTFSSLRNIEGFPGEPLIFRVDDSWREEVHEEKLAEAEVDPEVEEQIEASLAEVSVDVEKPQSHPKCTGTGTPEQCDLKFNKSFTETFNQIPPLKKSDVLHIPPVTHDWVIKGAKGKQDLITSNQCMSCHAGLVAPYGPSMFVGYDKDAINYYDPGWHISPYGEWRWTPMGLAGRDPIFFAQLESEIELLKKEFSAEQADLIGKNLTDTCLRCHGAMGKHQFDQDKTNPDDKFTVEHMYRTAKKDQHIGLGEAKYGALGRDGISCMICHRSVPREQPDDDDRPYLQFFLETSITGNFKLGPPDEIYGPFKDEEISPYVMEHGIAVKPKHSDYIQSSRMCGTCHAVTLPVVDHPFGDKKPDEHQQELVDAQNVPLFKKFHHHIEQATYLEWLNSEFENEFNTDNPNAKSCQDCHMSSDLHDDENDIHLDKISTRIATVQDNTYPDAENLTELENLEIRYREEGYKRHNFVGLNVFLIELFRQFDEVLGVRKNDFMTGSSKDIEHAVKNFKRQARNEVVDLKLATRLNGNQLTAVVDVQNKVGHRFPSGVGFRRAFLELLVVEAQEDGSEKIVWASGRTDENGLLIDSDDSRLKTEFFERETAGGAQLYQPHHQVIKTQDQVQVYETLLHTSAHEFTTSFIRGSYTIKDNRLLPKGWKAEGPDPALSGAYLKATHPGEASKKDPRYVDGSGSDEVTYEIELPTGIDTGKLAVRATMYYQAIPPYFLKALFDNAPNGKATQRLHYMISNANVKGTEIEDWKLFINSTESKIE